MSNAVTRTNGHPDVFLRVRTRKDAIEDIAELVRQAQTFQATRATAGSRRTIARRIAVRTQTAIAWSAHYVISTIQQIFPTAIIAFGLGITVAWISLLGYLLVTAIENLI